MTLYKQSARDRKRKKIRSKVTGSSSRPRLSVFKSNTAIYAQLIDDASGITLAAAQGRDAKAVGAELAKAAQAKKVKNVVFDRGGYIYTGKVKALADSARETGLKF
ncbi:MAG: 50S ribosomal protein L18 [bacterium]|nr:50S ribosomal protein L18 [bacterium]